VVVLQIGINDVLSNISIDIIMKNYRRIVEEVQNKGILLIPTIPFYTRYNPFFTKNQVILHDQIKAYLEGKGISYIDLNPIMAHENIMLKAYTSDGVHLSSAGYKVWQSELEKKFRLLDFDSL
jgi:lysophospholipase L1-like esterase